jgi:cytoskeletal protein CcmA (bactofilin family)
MFGKKAKGHHGISIKNLETIIGKSVSMEGDIKVSNGIRIDGQLDGNVTQQEGHAATVAIADGAQINGTIKAGHVIVSGKITGSIFAERIEILHTAYIQGDLSYKSIRIEPGAKIFGRLNQSEEKTEERSAQLNLLVSDGKLKQHS